MYEKLGRLMDIGSPSLTTIIGPNEKFVGRMGAGKKIKRTNLVISTGLNRVRMND